MGTNRVLLSILLILIMAVMTIGISGAQPDFKTIFVGEPEDAVLQKLAVLIEKKEMEKLPSGQYRTRWMNQNVECSFGFFQNKLYDIWIVFEAVPIDEYQGKLVKLVNEINPILVGIFGEVTSEYGFPEEDEIDRYLLTVAEWDLQEKTVLSGILKESGGYRAAVEIFQNELMMTKEEADQTEKAKNNE